MNASRVSIVCASLLLSAASGCSSSTAEPAGSTEQAIATYPGSGLTFGLATGRTYDDIATNLGSRLGDFRALGVSVLRTEIEGSDDARYQTIAGAASRYYGIELLALVSQAAVSDPLEVDDTGWFNSTYIPRYIARVERLMADIPSLKYLEVWNEPDVYGFFIGLPDGSKKPGTDQTLPSQDTRALRYAMLVTQVFEHFHEAAAKGQRVPTLLAFDFSRQDDKLLRDLVYNQPPIVKHRAGYRPGRLPDGLPADIVSIHGYGNPALRPDQPGYAYMGTLEDGIDDFLGATFADGRSVINESPVWYTEIGVGSGRFGEQGQADSMRTMIDTLRRHRQITGAFWYDYRDDEGNDPNRERNGLRGNRGDVGTVCAGTDGEKAWQPFVKRASWDVYADLSGARGRTTFADVPLCHWAHDEIEALYARGITTGAAPGWFDDTDPLKVKELDAFAKRAAGDLGAGVDGDSPAARRVDVAVKFYDGDHGAPYHGYFSDVPYTSDNANHWREIESLKDRHITTGIPTGDHLEFRPGDTLTRATAAVFISRAFNLH